MLKLIIPILFFSLSLSNAFSHEIFFDANCGELSPFSKTDKGLYTDELRMDRALLEPPDGKVYHGACLMTYENTPDPIGPYLSALNDSTIQPAVRGMFFTIPGERGPANALRGLSNFFQSADSIGFIPELSLFFMDKTGSTDSILAVSTVHDWIIDSIITLSKTYGKRMFLRIGGEFNGAGPGWNGGGYHPYLYVTMFRKIVDMFKSRDFRDSIAVNWCYEPDAANDFDSVDSRGVRWYPGDEYVDWFGLDVFDPSHFDQSLPDYTGRNITKKGKSERFLAMARDKGKPVFMSETSAKGMNISDDESDGIADWNGWFDKFFHFIEVHKEIKGFNYINANWPVSAYPGWGDARIQNSTYVTQKYTEEMKESGYIHLKSSKQNPIGPWNNPLTIAFSEDGTSFYNTKMFQDSSGVPSAIKWKGDTLACVFQWFRQPQNSPTWDKVAVKFSYNNGIEWTEPVPIVINGIPANYQRPFDPTLTVLEDNQLRIYFSSGNGIPNISDTSINTYSAISSDGINYSFEDGARYDNPQQRVIDPAVIYFNNEWHYSGPKGAPQDGAFHCTSADGLIFNKKADILSDNTHNWTGNFLVESPTELRFYGSGPDIWFNQSKDGYLWDKYTKTNIKGGDPTVLKVSDNNYLMIYVGKFDSFLPPPQKVKLLSPIDNQILTNDSETMEWEKSSHFVSNYHIQISFTNRFQSFEKNDSALTMLFCDFANIKPDSSYYWRVRARNETGWGEWSDVWKFHSKNASSISDAYSNENSLIVSPNPASDYLTISTNQEIDKIEIYSTLGLKVGGHCHEPVQNRRIDVSGLPPGVYFVRVMDKVSKFIKI